MTSKRPSGDERKRKRIRSKRLTPSKTANSIKWVGLVTLPDPDKSGRRHLVMAPAIRSRRIDSDDLDAAVLSVA